MSLNHRDWRLAQGIVDKAGGAGLLIATAESCTGGLVGAALTSVPGSSAIFDRGFTTYSNEAKADMLGVPFAMIDCYGAVSRQVAKAMAIGAIERSRADIAIAITGIAGPSGGNAEKPVGLVWFGFVRRGARARAERRVFVHGDRDFVRAKATTAALTFIHSALHTDD
ncbi:MAG: nicotinamide-nucleotide amidohydrolase family protein [Alphaproteobacteria bacterium]|nr:nicotinamide-nucleotide amidohydrolase family protein [Alphaproteobacteria bacterium]